MAKKACFLLKRKKKTFFKKIKLVRTLVYDLFSRTDVVCVPVCVTVAVPAIRPKLSCTLFTLGVSLFPDQKPYFETIKMND